MNSTRIIVAEYGIAVGFASYEAVRASQNGGSTEHYMPFPAPYMRSALAFSVLAILDVVVPGIGALLGAGFLLALFVKNYKQYFPSNPYLYTDDFLGKYAAGLSANSFIILGQAGTGTSGSTHPSSFIVGGAGGTQPPTTSPSSGGDTVTV